MLLHTNRRDSERDPDFEQLKLVGKGFLWEAGVPGSHPRPNQAKEAATIPRATGALVALTWDLCGEGDHILLGLD